MIWATETRDSEEPNTGPGEIKRRRMPSLKGVSILCY